VIQIIHKKGIKQKVMANKGVVQAYFSTSGQPSYPSHPDRQVKQQSQ
jgi:hypothetical protein